jgi:STE24 endopeptidase
MNNYLYIILAGYILTLIIGYWLKILNIRYLKAHGTEIPEEFRGHIDASLLQKTRDYTVENSRFSIIESVFDNGVLVVFLFGGILDIYNEWVLSMNMGFISRGVLFFLVLVIAQTIVSIPFNLYSTFRIENRFGFNTMTPVLWVKDLIKSLIISAIILMILVSVGLWIIRESPDHWWLYVWGFFFIFSLFIMYISPYVIEPLFNKFTPLSDKELEEGIREVCKKAGIRISRIFKMDASKRSKHTNAYFTGIGRVKRVVLYDTLIERMEKNEVVSVLAHEIGHWKKRHVFKRIMISELVALVSLYIAFRLLQTDFLLRIFSISSNSLYAHIIIIGFIGGIVAFPFTPLSNFLSRRHELQADRFACEITGNPEALASSFIKLSKDNLSNLYPHPLYAAFYYSHPPVVQRIRYIRGNIKV